MSASTTAPHPLDLPLPREAPPTSRRNKGIAAGLRRSLSGSITIPDSVSETALKHRNGLRRLTKRLRDVDPSLPARATSFVGMGGMIIREIRGGSRDEEVLTATSTTTTTTTTRAVPETMVRPDGVETVIPGILFCIFLNILWRHLWCSHHDGVQLPPLGLKQSG
jgi:hypothetical protein